MFIVVVKLDDEKAGLLEMRVLFVWRNALPTFSAVALTVTLPIASTALQRAFNAPRPQETVEV